MKIFVGKGSYFKYSSESFDYVDMHIKTRSQNSRILFCGFGRLRNRFRDKLDHNIPDIGKGIGFTDNR